MVGGQVLDLEAERGSFVNVENAEMQMRNAGKIALRFGGKCGSEDCEFGGFCRCFR